jgi:hypothetical protein
MCLPYELGVMNPKVGSTGAMASQSVCVTVLLVALNSFVIPIRTNILPQMTDTESALTYQRLVLTSFQKIEYSMLRVIILLILV